MKKSLDDGIWIDKIGTGESRTKIHFYDLEHQNKIPE